MDIGMLAGRRTYVDLLTDPSIPRGLNGAGTVHHVAFRVPDDATQVAAGALRDWATRCAALPWVKLSGTGVRVGYSIALSIPVAGEWLAFLFFGGPVIVAVRTQVGGVVSDAPTQVFSAMFDVWRTPELSVYCARTSRNWSGARPDGRMKTSGNGEKAGRPFYYNRPPRLPPADDTVNR